MSRLLLTALIHEKRWRWRWTTERNFHSQTLSERGLAQEINAKLINTVSSLSFFPLFLEQLYPSKEEEEETRVGVVEGGNCTSRFKKLLPVGPQLRVKLVSFFTRGAAHCSSKSEI